MKKEISRFPEQDWLLQLVGFTLCATSASSALGVSTSKLPLASSAFATATTSETCAHDQATCERVHDAACKRQVEPFCTPMVTVLTLCDQA
jgi:hypothetical protein